MISIIESLAKREIRSVIDFLQAEDNNSAEIRLRRKYYEGLRWDVIYWFIKNFHVALICFCRLGGTWKKSPRGVRPVDFE